MSLKNLIGLQTLQHLQDVFIDNAAKNAHLQRAAAATGYGFDPDKYTRPFPGSNTTTIINMDGNGGGSSGTQTKKPTDQSSDGNLNEQPDPKGNPIKQPCESGTSGIPKGNGFGKLLKTLLVGGSLIGGGSGLAWLGQYLFNDQQSNSVAAPLPKPYEWKLDYFIEDDAGTKVDVKDVPLNNTPKTNPPGVDLSPLDNIGPVPDDQGSNGRTLDESISRLENSIKRHNKLRNSLLNPVDSINPSPGE